MSINDKAFLAKALAIVNQDPTASAHKKEVKFSTVKACWDNMDKVKDKESIPDEDLNVLVPYFRVINDKIA